MPGRFLELPVFLGGCFIMPHLEQQIDIRLHAVIICWRVASSPECKLNFLCTDYISLGTAKIIVVYQKKLHTMYLTHYVVLIHNKHQQTRFTACNPAGQPWRSWVGEPVPGSSKKSVTHCHHSSLSLVTISQSITNHCVFFI